MGPVDFVRQMEEALIRLCAVLWRARRTHLRPHRRVVRPSPQLSKARLRRPSKGPPPAGPSAKSAPSAFTSPAASLRTGSPSTSPPTCDYFRLINPCGITDKPVTSLAARFQSRRLAHSRIHRAPGGPAVRHRLQPAGRVAGSLDALRRTAGSAIQSDRWVPVFPLKTRRSRFRPKSSACANCPAR